MIPRLGDYRLTATLASDPFGSLHRAVRVEGGTFGRHALVRRFSPDLLAGGLRERLGEGIATSLKLGELRGLAPHCRIYHRAAEPWVAYDHVPGLTLAELLGICRAQGLPMGLEHALTVLRDLAGALSGIHARGLTHGLLVPELVWVSHDGTASLLDTPVAPHLRSAWPEGLAQAPAGGTARDLHLLACLGWRMLTLAPRLPEHPEDLRAGLEAWSQQAEVPLPDPLRELFARMVGLGPAFGSLEAFQEASGVALRLEAQAPSTFNLAFLIHTLLRDRIPAELKALEAERGALWTVSQAVPILPAIPRPPASGPLRSAWGLAGAVGLGLVLAAGVWGVRRAGDREAGALRQALADAQRHKAEVEQAQADLEARVGAEAQRRRDLEQERALARDAARLEALTRELATTRQRQEALAADQVRAKAQVVAAEIQARRLQAKAAVPVGLPSVPVPPVLPPQVAVVPPPVGPPKAPPEEDQPRAIQVAPLRLGPGQRLEGRLRLRVFVDEQGRPLRATVVAGAGGPLAEAAVEAALRSTFQPARREGRAFRAWGELTY